jgi:hypothetical protein
MTPKPKLILLKAIPAWRVSGNWAFSNSGYTAEQNGINGDIIRDSLKPAIDTIAASRPTQVVQVVDLYTPFLALQSLVTDGVHPTRVGQDSLARFLYRAIQPTVTSIRKNAPGRALRAPALGRRVYLGGGRMPEWMRDMRVMSVNGKAVRVGSDGKLPAGVYLVRPKAAAAGK